jgi:hypothetical protein
MRFNIVKVVIGRAQHCYDVTVGGRFLERYDTLREARAGEAMYAGLLAGHTAPERAEVAA